MHRIIPVTLLLGLMASGCTTIYARLAYDFDNSMKDKRVYYESGAEDIALRVVQDLSKSINSVENDEYIGFKDAQILKVYLFNNKESYSRFSYSSIKSRGSSTTDEIYLSPKLRENITSLPRILAHELSHVHLRQFIGTWQYVINIPGWFHEGLAVETSNGGGAEKVSTEKAIEAIRKGNHFTPTEKGSIFGHRTAHDYGLKPHMYYRQAALFISYLQQLDIQIFKKSYISLTEGEEFKKVWKKYYGKSLSELWNQFLEHIKA